MIVNYFYHSEIKKSAQKGGENNAWITWNRNDQKCRTVTGQDEQLKSENALEVPFVGKQNGADFTEPITAGIFVSVVAWASYQRTDDKTPYWRTLKANGELNSKYPGGIDAQKEMLEKEGHTIIQKGRINIKYYVKDYEQALFIL